MNDGQYETPEPDRTKPRVAPRVVLASAGVVVATLFATVAALTSGSPDAAPAKNSPLEDVVSKDTLRSAPGITSTTVPSKTQVDALSSTDAPPTTTTTPRKTKVTTVTQPDGTTTTTTVEDTTPEQPTKPPTKPTTTDPTTTTTTTTTQPDPTTTTTTTTTTSPPPPNDGTGDQ